MLPFTYIFSTANVGARIAFFTSAAPTTFARVFLDSLVASPPLAMAGANYRSSQSDERPIEHHRFAPREEASLAWNARGQERVSSAAAMFPSPNQVYQSGLKTSHIELPDAKTICLMECPLPAEDGLNFVCDYPEGDIRLSVDDWIDRDYDYFEYLTPDMRNSSLQLQGPCYPVIFPSVNGKSHMNIRSSMSTSVIL